MRGLLKKLQCPNYITLVAASSIIRPGVASSGMMRAYIERFHHPELVEYIHPVFEEHLGETYGVMVYQEDVMIVAHHYGGLTLSRADILRRAMSGNGDQPPAPAQGCDAVSCPLRQMDAVGADLQGQPAVGADQEDDATSTGERAQGDSGRFCVNGAERPIDHRGSPGQGLRDRQGIWRADRVGKEPKSRYFPAPPCTRRIAA